MGTKEMDELRPRNWKDENQGTEFFHLEET